MRNSALGSLWRTSKTSVCGLKRDFPKLNVFKKFKKVKPRWLWS